MKIAICGLIYNFNYGEDFVKKSLEYLIEKCGGGYEFVEVDLYGRDSYGRENDDQQRMLYAKEVKISEKIVFVLLTVFAKIFKHSAEKLKYIRWSQSPFGKKYLYNFYKNKFSECKAIIIDGAGIIESEYNHYENYLSLIASISEEMKIPLIFNAVGCVGEYKKGWSGDLMRKALTSKMVCDISVRDNKEIMYQYLKGSHLLEEVEQVADPAVWISDAYGVKKMDEPKKIGLGLIRGNAFSGYGLDVHRKDIVEKTIALIDILEKEGYEWELFTNGFEVDREVGNEILERLEEKNKSVRVPESGLDLINIISSYKGIVAYRLHACIAAFSLKIPVIGICWNDKVSEFMKYIGFPNRSVPVEKYESSYINEQLMIAINEGYDSDKWMEVRNSIMNRVSSYMNKIRKENKS